MVEEPGDTERMSDLEALMWLLEADPHLSSTFANISFLDRSPDPEVLRQRMWRATRVVPRLRRRVVDGFGPRRPSWQEDPDFDLEPHLLRVQLPSGSTDADALEFATEVAATPFDHDRPLWEFTVVEGLPDGRAAMVQKIHHTITDGSGGIRMSVEFIDLERHPTQPPPLDDDPVPPPSNQSMLSGAINVLSDGARRNTDAVRRLAGSAVGLVRDPQQLTTVLAELPNETAATVRSAIRQFGVIDAHRSPLWAERSLQRSLRTFDVDLDAVRALAHDLGGSVNDVFVAAATGGAARYHRSHGFEPEELRMSMPVSTRTDRSPGGNAFTPTRVLVPLAEDPRERFTQIHERLLVTKSERAMGLMASLASLAKLVPQPVLVRLARQQVMTVDFTTSNVRAAPFDLYIAGALMERNYPLGPVAGTSFNLTTMSYRGMLNLGLHMDTAAITEPDELARDIAESFEELLSLRRS